MLGLDLSLGRYDRRYGAADPYNGAMVWEIDTSLGVGDSFAVPYGAGEYDAVITYPDESTQVLSGSLVTGSINKVFVGPTAGLVTISGVFPHPNFNNGGDKLKLTKVLNIGTTGLMSLSRAFYGCTNLTSLASSSVNTSLCDSYAFTFFGCTSLVTADVSGFDTGAGQTFTNMFYNCSALTGLDVSGFNTVFGADFSNMFFNCGGVPAIDVSGFDTALCANFSNMFRGCTSITTLDVSGFNTAKATNLSFMFFNCGSVTGLDVSGFDTALCANFSFMFSGCGSVTGLDVSGFNIAQGTNFSTFMSGSGMSTATYDATLAAWALQTFQAGLTDLNFGSSTYTNTEPTITNRATVASNFVTFVDGGPA